MAKKSIPFHVSLPQISRLVVKAMEIAWDIGLNWLRDRCTIYRGEEIGVYRNRAQLISYLSNQTRGPPAIEARAQAHTIYANMLNNALLTGWSVYMNSFSISLLSSIACERSIENAWAIRLETTKKPSTLNKFPRDIHGFNYCNFGSDADSQIG